jgi:hypothetical protein
MNTQTYEVVTKGRLSASLLSGLHGLDLDRVQDGKSYFSATVSDQAVLFRALTVLRDLNVELLSITASGEWVPRSPGHNWVSWRYAAAIDWTNKLGSGELVSSRRQPEVQSYQLVVVGEVTTAFVAALDGFEVVGAEDGLTNLVGWVEGQGHLYDILAVIRDFKVDFVSIQPSGD